MRETSNSKPNSNSTSRDAISPDVGKARPEQTECDHPEGFRTQEYDADGCGYYLWTCLTCGYTEFDDLP